MLCHLIQGLPTMTTQGLKEGKIWLVCDSVICCGINDELAKGCHTLSIRFEALRHPLQVRVKPYAEQGLLCFNVC
jgi:hypothetical protein